MAREMERKPFTELRDFTATPAALEREIDAGNMDGLATLYKLKGGRLGLMNGGFSAEGIFAVLCELRRQMIATQGMVDEDETVELRRVRAELADAKAARETMEGEMRAELHTLGQEVARLRAAAGEA